jgi:hypothetical protein
MGMRTNAQYVEALNHAATLLNVGADPMHPAEHVEALRELRDSMGTRHDIGFKMVCVPSIEWTDADRNYGTAVVTMFGGSFHLEAFRVYEEDGTDVVDVEQEDKVAAVEAVMSDDAFATVQIGGLPYVVIITPFDR